MRLFPYLWGVVLREFLSFEKATELNPHEGDEEAEKALMKALNAPPAEEYVFARQGDGWYIRGFGESGFVRNLKGFANLARLIRSPGEPVSMRELTGMQDDARLNADRQTPQPALDEQSLREIRDELAERQADLQEAKDENNTVEADLAQADTDRLKESLGSALGKGGKVRDLNNPNEQMRPTILTNLRRAYKRLKESSMTMLAEHFESSVTSESGACVYRPAGDHPTWRFERTADEK